MSDMRNQPDEPDVTLDWDVIFCPKHLEPLKTNSICTERVTLAESPLG